MDSRIAIFSSQCKMFEIPVPVIFIVFFFLWVFFVAKAAVISTDFIVEMFLTKQRVFGTSGGTSAGIHACSTCGHVIQCPVTSSNRVCAFCQLFVPNY